MLDATFVIVKQSGAAEACWAHNPEVVGSKPASARIRYLKCFSPKINCNSHPNQESCAGIAISPHIVATSAVLVEI